jgi:uncharacterized protein YdaU (DUF1376 family)
MASPQFDFFPRDFLAATIGWPASTRGHYITLLCVQWEQGSIAADPERLEAISPGVAAEWQELEGKFPVCEDGRRRNARLERERAYRDSRSAAGKAGAKARWQEQCESHSQSHVRSHVRTGMRNECPPSPSPSPAQEEIQPAARDATSDPPQRRKRSQPADPIRWTPAAGWEGITDEDRKTWAVAYPACDLSRELARMGEWLKANPAKAKKSRWRSFVTRWLTTTQDRGGGSQSNRPPARGEPGRLTVEEIEARNVKRAWWRGDAMQSMTEAQYQAWRQSQATASPPAALAARLRANSPAIGKSHTEEETPF